MTRTKIATAALTASVLVGLAASAGAQAGYQKAKFKAEVKGVQTYTYEYHHASTNRCDISIDSSTRERIKFASTKPVLLTASRLPGLKEPVLTSGLKPLRIPTKAKITRSHSHSTSPLPPGCPDNGGGVIGDPQTPDCGTKVVKPWWLSVDYYRKDHVELQPEDIAGSDLFERCGNARWPYLLNGESFGKRQSAELPKGELFDPKIGKLITIGSGNHSIVGPESDEDTQIRWELSLTRIVPKKRK